MQQRLARGIQGALEYRITLEQSRFINYPEQTFLAFIIHHGESFTIEINKETLRIIQTHGRGQRLNGIYFHMLTQGLILGLWVLYQQSSEALLLDHPLINIALIQDRKSTRLNSSHVAIS